MHAAFVRQADCYARAVPLAAELAEACGRGEHPDDRLRRVLELLDEVAASEAGIASEKRRWEQEGRRAGVALRGVMARAADLIRQLAGHLRTIEESARARRDVLAAELDACNRRRQMQRAYLRKS